MAETTGDNSVKEDLESVINKQAMRKYCEIVRKQPTTIETIHELVAGSNMNYSCCNEDQSMYIYKTCRKEIVDEMDDPKLVLKYFEEKQSPLMNAIFTVVFIPKTANRRDHLVFFGCLHITFSDIFPNVGFARKFEICGKYIPTYFILVLACNLNGIHT